MSFLNDKLKTKKAGHSDGFRNLIDSTENERNIPLSKSSRHFLRDLEIKGAMGQIPEHGIEDIIISPDNKIEPYGTTTPVNANEDDNLKIEGYRQLKWAYMDGRQYFTLSNIRQTIDFHMHIRFESFSQVGEKFLFQNGAGNGYMVGIVGIEGGGGSIGGTSFNFPYYPYQASDTQGIFSIGPIRDGIVWDNGGGGCHLQNTSVTEDDGVYTISGQIDGYQRTATFTENTDQIWLFANRTGQSGFIGRVGFILLYNGYTKIAELVPAERLSDGAIGFLDTVSKEFYTSRTATPFYDHYDSANYNNVVRNLPREDRIVYKLTLKSAKRGLPKGYREMTQLVTPEAPGDYDRFVDFGNTQLLPSSIHGLIADIDVTLLYASGYGTVLTKGIIAFGAYSTVKVIEEDTDSIEKEYDYWGVDEAGSIRSNRVIIACQIDNNASNPAHECLMNLTGYYFNTGAKFSASRTSDVKYNHVAATKFAIGAMRNSYSRSGFAFRKVTFTEQATGKVAIEIVPCKREDGEYGLYLVNHIQNKEEFFSFTLVNVSDIQNFDVFPEDGTTLL